MLHYYILHINFITDTLVKDFFFDKTHPEIDVSLRPYTVIQFIVILLLILLIPSNS